jgi:hypothetical protein
MKHFTKIVLLLFLIGLLYCAAYTQRVAAIQERMRREAQSESLTFLTQALYLIRQGKDDRALVTLESAVDLTIMELRTEDLRNVSISNALKIVTEYRTFVPPSSNFFLTNDVSKQRRNISQAIIREALK